jgi:hypothetical protein
MTKTKTIRLTKTEREMKAEQDILERVKSLGFVIGCTDQDCKAIWRLSGKGLLTITENEVVRCSTYAPNGGGWTGGCHFATRLVAVGK